jgi:hypothetical protein
MHPCITIFHTIHTSKGSVEAFLDDLISRGFLTSMEEQSFVQVGMPLFVFVTVRSILKTTASSLLRWGLVPPLPVYTTARFEFVRFSIFGCISLA